MSYAGYEYALKTGSYYDLNTGDVISQNSVHWSNLKASNAIDNRNRLIGKNTSVINTFLGK